MRQRRMNIQSPDNHDAVDGSPPNPHSSKKTKQKNILHDRKIARFARTVTYVLLGWVTVYAYHIIIVRIEGELDSYDVVKDKDDMSNLSKFEKTWPTLQDELCPNYEPHHALGDHLFMAARREMNITDWKNQAGNATKFYFGEFDTPTYFLGHDGKTYLEYVRIWKCANNQIRYWLGKHLTKKKKIPSSSTSDPCVFTVIRDPISHFLSGYNEVENFKPRNIELQKKLNYSYKKLEQGSTERFNMFVNELLTSPKFGVYWVHAHSYSMSRILGDLKGKGKRLTGYLPSITNITKTFPPFLNSTCPGALDEEEIASEMRVLGQHRSSRDRLNTYAAAKSVWGEMGPTARALCAMHAMDYACWRDLPEGIPQLCQDVYSSDIFLDIVQAKDLADP